MRSRFVSFCIFLTLSVGLAAAQTNQKDTAQTKQKVAAQTNPKDAAQMNQKGVGSFVAASNKNALKITLKASRDQAIAGSDFGITAQIENTSDKAVYIAPASFAMTAPPELDSEGPRDWLAFFPGVLTVSGQPYDDTVIVIEPGSNISAFWSGNIQHSQRATPQPGLLSFFCGRFGIDCPELIRGLGFSPGKYTLTIVGSYWDTYEGARNKSIERHTQATELLEQINAPQSVILFGAAIGGAIAFLLLTKVQPSAPTGWAPVRWIPGLLSAVLLSMIVTILLARLAQSQFIISVTVNDFWGAVAVGFVVAASGPTILQKFTALVRGTTPPASVPTPSQTLSSISFNDPASAVPGAAASLKVVGSNLSSTDTSLKLFSNTIPLTNVAVDGTSASASLTLPDDYDPTRRYPGTLISSKTGAETSPIDLPAARTA
jgi:hypothetical protein